MKANHNPNKNIVIKGFTINTTIRTNKLPYTKTSHTAVTLARRYKSEWSLGFKNGIRLIIKEDKS